MKYLIPIMLGSHCLVYLVASQFNTGHINDLELKVKHQGLELKRSQEEAYFYSGELLKANTVIKNSQQLLGQIVSINKDQIATNTQNLVYATSVETNNLVFVYTNVVFNNTTK